MRWEYLLTVYFMYNGRRKYMLNQNRTVKDEPIISPLKMFAVVNHTMLRFGIPLMFTLRVRRIQERN